MQRYFIKNDSHKDGVIQSTDNMIRHMKKVLRYSNGDQVICVDENANVYLCTIADIDKGILIREKGLQEYNELDVDVTLVYGLPKGDKFEFILQKATELGVKRIVPLRTKRSIIRIDDKRFLKKYERYNRIITEACEQCERETKPILEPLTVISKLGQYRSDVNLVAYEKSSREGEKSVLKKALDRIKTSITIVVGPEGGFDPLEIKEMNKLGFESCSLGKRILRTETAPLYMLSVIGFERELSK